MTLKERIVKLWTSILNGLHLYTDAQMREHMEFEKDTGERLLETLQHLSEEEQKRLETLKQYQTLQAEYERVSNELSSMMNERDELRHDVDVLNAEVDKNAEMAAIWKSRVDEMRDAASVNNEFVKEVQKQLGLTLESSPLFGFPSMIAIPGSTSFDTGYVSKDGTGYAVVRGKSVLLDDMTMKIDSTPSIRERMNLIIDYMSRYGILEQITKSLINYGALSITLAYNTHCTAYEIYYESVAKVYHDDSIFVIKDNTVEVNKDNPTE